MITHVETVVLLSRETGPGTKFAYIDYEVKDSDQVSSRAKATYAEMKKWIEEEYNLKVHSAYIAQIKGKLGLEKERVGNNWKKGEGPSMPDCPPEKEEAIKAAFKHFGLI